MGPIAKTFVMVNRVFGWFLAVGGVLVLVGAVQRLVLGRSAGLGLGWHFLIGAVLLAVGVVYIRAPLTREDARDQTDSAKAK
jgi:predicted phage tail protein